ncbi:MAG: hypothetical protein AAF564_04990 [Bacteroidota bacterium]
MKFAKRFAFAAICLLLLGGCTNNYESLEPNELYRLAQKAANDGKLDKAADISRVALQKGDIRAQVLLGNVLYDEDPEAAFRHWHAAAEKGEPAAKYILGFFAYTNSEDEEAVFWISDAASQGDKEAQYLFAMMYQEGRGVEMNFEKARYWLNKAADQNHTYAIQQLKVLDNKT